MVSNKRNHFCLPWPNLGKAHEAQCNIESLYTRAVTDFAFAVILTWHLQGFAQFALGLLTALIFSPTSNPMTPLLPLHWSLCCSLNTWGMPSSSIPYRLSSAPDALLLFSSRHMWGSMAHIQVFAQDYLLSEPSPDHLRNLKSILLLWFTFSP